MDEIQTLRDEVERLTKENNILRRTIDGHKRQLQMSGGGDEVRQLRAKIAEWEGNTRMVNGGYYHGSRFIRPLLDEGNHL